MKDISGEAKIQHLVRVLDEDHDGNINLEELGEVSAWTIQIHKPTLRIGLSSLYDLLF